MKITHRQFYITMKKIYKITDTAKKQDNLKFTVKEEEKQSVFVSILTTLIPVLIIALLFIFLAKPKVAAAVVV